MLQNAWVTAFIISERENQKGWGKITPSRPD